MALAGGHLVPYCTYKAADAIVTLKCYYIKIFEKCNMTVEILNIILTERVHGCLTKSVEHLIGYLH